MTPLPSRVGFKWSVNEVLALEREFDLLGWSIEQIAQKHNRTSNAIMFKLNKEGFLNLYATPINEITNSWN